jgi:hypothetical protein
MSRANTDSLKMPAKTDNTTSRTKRESQKVDVITNSFLHEIRSLLFAKEEATKVLGASVDKHMAAFNAFLEKYESEDTNDASSRQFKVPVNKIEELKLLAHDLSSSTRSMPLFHRGLT